MCEEVLGFTKQGLSKVILEISEKSYTSIYLPKSWEQCNSTSFKLFLTRWRLLLIMVF